MHLRVLLAGLLVACGTQPPSEARAVFDRYMAAANAHDLATLAAMTDAGVIWQLGPYRLVGKEAALGPYYADLALHTTLAYRGVTIRGDTVEDVVIERNDATRAYGPDSLVHYARYVFRHGLMWRKEEWKPSPDLPEFVRRGAPFRAWVRRVHPDVDEKLRPDSTYGPFGEVRARLLASMLQEWLAAGKPGS
jgi:hypothetical protein